MGEVRKVRDEEQQEDKPALKRAAADRRQQEGQLRMAAETVG